MSKDKQYLGDSVYINHDGYHIVLTTENGGPPSNTICLEPHLLPMIAEYYERLKVKYSPVPVDDTHSENDDVTE